jgi:tRNA uridine 5-carboxymethylaminomethyl modification enzyme
MIYPEEYDLIVIGGGHGGVEAACAAARMGVKTLLLTQNIETIGQLSCNPSVGGIGKSQAIKELDALSGLMALAADKSGINFNMLNRSKGPAMQSLHVVVDRVLYKQAILNTVQNQKNLSVFQQTADDLVLQGDRVTGVITQLGIQINCKAVVLTAGTFLNGKIHVGLQNYAAGRMGDAPSVRLAERLKELNMPQGRLKTGTPARIDGKSIDFSKMVAKNSDGDNGLEIPVFSFMGNKEMHPKQMACWTTKTNLETHEVLRSGFDKSPMFTGIIEGVGPRYCPSIEDKITRFSEKDSHQIILEPEGLNTTEYYPNGISTSLPFDIQYKAIRTIPGLENAHLTRPAYAVEYDYYDPREFSSTLESKHIKGLWCSGQILGSTGYPESATMSAIAGINAALYVKGEKPWVPQRHEAYMGVMIDDLVTKGVTEPYRLFTGRAEYRLQLREDNADQRLTEIGRKLGVVTDDRWEAYSKKKEAIDLYKQKMASTWINPKMISQEDAIANLGTEMIKEYNLADLLKRPNIKMENISKLVSIAGLDQSLTVEKMNEIYGVEQAKAIYEQVEIHNKYSGYIDRQNQDIEKLMESENIKLPLDFNYSEIEALSTEVKQKLNKYKPENLGQASRISGVTPAAVSLLLIYMKKNGLLTRKSLISDESVEQDIQSPKLKV